MESTLILKSTLFSVSVPYFRSIFGQRYQPMEFGGLFCRGTESSLQECDVSSYYVMRRSNFGYCNQWDYVGVKCIPRITGKHMYPIVNIVCVVSITN